VLHRLGCLEDPLDRNERGVAREFDRPRDSRLVVLLGTVGQTPTILALIVHDEAMALTEQIVDKVRSEVRLERRINPGVVGLRPVHSPNLERITFPFDASRPTESEKRRGAALTQIQVRELQRAEFPER
jgi:hypothetical protein